MRRRAPWMSGNTDRILEFLADSGAAHTKQGILVNLELAGEDISYSTIQRHAQRLAKIGLLEVARERGRYYRITEAGRQYLDGELAVTDLDADE